MKCSELINYEHETIIKKYAILKAIAHIVSSSKLALQLSSFAGVGKARKREFAPLCNNVYNTSSLKN